MSKGNVKSRRTGVEYMCCPLLEEPQQHLRAESRPQLAFPPAHDPLQKHGSVVLARKAPKLQKGFYSSGEQWQRHEA